MNKKITVNDSWQQNYSYELSAEEGQEFDADFRPELSPKQMLELGVFSGAYFSDRPNEFPADWFKSAKMHADGHSDVMNNFFEIKASQALEVWQEKGWIHPDDPRGWFQWYCRYYLGRRMEDDQRQIKRWKAMTRHVAQVKKGCKTGDLTCRRRQRQALLHWAYDSRKF